MKKQLFEILILVLFISACHENIERDPRVAGIIIDTGRIKELIEKAIVYTDSVQVESEYFDYQNTSLSENYTDTVFAKFSSDSTEDRFTFFVPKGMVVNTKSILRVTSKNGRLIYEHIFPTSDLINGYATYQIKNDQEMAEYVLKEAKEVLGNQLHNPNQLPETAYINQVLPEDFENYEVFSEMKKSKRVMLDYCLNEESHYFMVYSQKLNKVVPVLYCC